MTGAAPLLIALGVGLALQPVAIRVLRSRGVVDVPGARSSHTTATVRGGGVVLVASLLAGAAVRADGTALVLLAVVTLAAAVGLAEDLVGVAVVPRFALLCLAAAPLALLVPGPPARQLLAGGLAALFGLALVNATNFMDGINGISAATGAAAGTAYAVLAQAAGLEGVGAVALAVVGACVGFAPFNVPRAKVFLGDSGSYGLGAALGGLAVALVAAGVPVEAALAPLAVGLADTGSTLVRRYRAGEAWHLPHRTHVYQRLTDHGWSHGRVSSLVLVLVLVCSLLGSASFGSLPLRLTADLVLLGLLAGYLALPALLPAPPGRPGAHAAAAGFAT